MTKQKEKTSLKVLKDVYSYFVIRVKNFLGFYDSDTDKKLHYLRELWRLRYSDIPYNDVMQNTLFKNFLDVQIINIKRRLKFYELHKYGELAFIIILLLFIITRISIPYSLMVLLSTILILYYIIMIFIPFDNRIATVKSVLKWMEKYELEKFPLKSFLDSANNNDLDLKITLPFTPSEIAVFFMLLLSSNDVKGIHKRELVDFVEYNCQQCNGKPYKNLHYCPTKKSRIRGFHPKDSPPML
ncbi:MAG: hypothetical protein AB1777_09440 [Bacteroidota bacterium]